MTDKEKIITRYRKYISYQKKLDQAEKALKKFIYSHRSEDVVQERIRLATEVVKEINEEEK